MSVESQKNHSCKFAFFFALIFYLCGIGIFSAVSAQETEVSLWKLRSKHFIFGMPIPIDNRYNFKPDSAGQFVPGISVLVREGFVIGHCDRFKVPLWVSMRWTRKDYERSEIAPKYNRTFKSDEELPWYAQAGTNYHYHETGMQRGHMARHKDNAAWGKDNSDAGCRMSNIVPQSAVLNTQSWLALENAHRTIVEKSDSIHEIWVISGAIFENGVPKEKIAEGVGVPQETYKVIAWFGRDGQFQARGYILSQNDQSKNPEEYLCPIDEIEEKTGLDFFPELNDQEEAELESLQPDNLWGE